MSLHTFCSRKNASTFICRKNLVAFYILYFASEGQSVRVETINSGAKSLKTIAGTRLIYHTKHNRFAKYNLYLTCISFFFKTVFNITNSTFTHELIRSYPIQNRFVVLIEVPKKSNVLNIFKKKS